MTILKFMRIAKLRKITIFAALLFGLLKPRSTGWVLCLFFDPFFLSVLALHLRRGGGHILCRDILHSLGKPQWKQNAAFHTPVLEARKQWMNFCLDENKNFSNGFLHSYHKLPTCNLAVIVVGSGSGSADGVRNWLLTAVLSMREHGWTAIRQPTIASVLCMYHVHFLFSIDKRLLFRKV